MKKLIRAAAMICLAAVLHAQPPAPARASPPLVIVNANLVNVRNGQVTANASIMIRNGRIESMGSGPSTALGAGAPAGARVVDLKGKYLLPGLIDAHTHAADFAALRRALESGVTTRQERGCIRLYRRRLP